MRDRAIAIVESPLQLINANEYIKKYALESKTDFYFVSSRGTHNLDQLRSTYKALKLKGKVFEVSVLNIDKSIVTRLSFYLKIIRAARKMPKNYSLVLVGHMLSIYQNVLANTIKNSECIYLDDGNASVAQIKQLKKEKIKSFSPFSKRIFPLLLGFNVNLRYGKKGLNYFTIYKDLIVENHPYLCFDINDLEYLKSEYGKKEINKNFVYFIGTPFYWNNKSYENFEQDIKKVSEFYQNKKVFYFPHRYESKEQLEIINNLGWKIVKNELPIELLLIELENLPLEFGFFYSSAVDNISKLIPNMNFKSFEIDNTEFLEDGKNIYKLYRSYEKKNMITVIKL
ncbi:hypothetical protein [Aquimarina algicola]|uniref:Uncharacterized protein n=1 Tax=Aquimarina algicola TaxID=2589995 RepID=A0A504JGT0_9FLAO|nr:hypothetical protein [Aquimarina algicola]TPN87882.1 hypothetical protein FHK87_09930 [Aquimarina algicola]